MSAKEPASPKALPRRVVVIDPVGPSRYAEVAHKLEGGLVHYADEDDAPNSVLPFELQLGRSEPRRHYEIVLPEDFHHDDCPALKASDNTEHKGGGPH